MGKDDLRATRGLPVDDASGRGGARVALDGHAESKPGASRGRRGEGRAGARTDEPGGPPAGRGPGTGTGSSGNGAHGPWRSSADRAAGVVDRGRVDQAESVPPRAVRSRNRTRWTWGERAWSAHCSRRVVHRNPIRPGGQHLGIQVGHLRHAAPDKPLRSRLAVDRGGRVAGRQPDAGRRHRAVSVPAVHDLGPRSAATPWRRCWSAVTSRRS